MSPRSTAKLCFHPKKALLCIWRSIFGVVHFEGKPVQTVKADLFCEQLDLNQLLIKNFKLLSTEKTQHDNARGIARFCAMGFPFISIVTFFDNKFENLEDFA